MERYKQEDYLREQYWGEGKSQGEIAEENGVYGGLIHYWMEKHGIDRRDATTERKRHGRVEYAYFQTDARGYERWTASDGEGGKDMVFVHRLLAVSEYGFEALRDRDAHHEIPISWLNTPDNVVPMDRKQHRKNHKMGNDSWENKKTPWRDKETLQRLYHGKKMHASEVADKLGCDHKTIRTWMEKHGIEKRSMSEAAKLRWDRE